MKPKVDSLREDNAFVPKTGRGKTEYLSGKRKGFYGVLRSKVKGTISSGRKKTGSKFGRGICRSQGAANRQRVTVKARYQKHTKAGGVKSLRRHLSYLSREGVNRDGNRAELFAREGEISKEKGLSLAEEWSNDRHHWRVIISPENGDKLDLDKFAEEYVFRMEEDLGTRLKWIAAAHYDTENPHVHLLIRGKTDTGKDLVIRKNYVSFGMRDLAEELATRSLGPRREWEVEQVLEKSITQERVGPIDQKLIAEAKRNEHGSIDVSRKKNSHDQKMVELKVRRLKFLRERGLARRVAPGQWQIASNVEKILKDLSIRDDIIKTMHVRMRKGRENILFEPGKHNPVSGRVVHKGLIDPLADETYMLLEAADGRNYYVALSKYSEAQGAESKVGDTVRIGNSGFSQKPVDKVIENVARKGRGTISSSSVIRYLKEYKEVRKSATVDGYWKNLERRLVSLERRDIISRSGPDSWHIPKDFASRVSEKSLQYARVTVERSPTRQRREAFRERGR